MIPASSNYLPITDLASAINPSDLPDDTIFGVRTGDGHDVLVRAEWYVGAVDECQRLGRIAEKAPRQIPSGVFGPFRRNSSPTSCLLSHVPLFSKTLILCSFT